MRPEGLEPGGRACHWYRDRDGFCQLQNRCWAGRACPATQAAADRARDDLITELMTLYFPEVTPEVAESLTGA